MFVPELDVCCLCGCGASVMHFVASVGTNEAGFGEILRLVWMAYRMDNVAIAEAGVVLVCSY